MIKYFSLLILMCFLFSCSSKEPTLNVSPADGLVPFSTVVDLENQVYVYETPGNGSGPMWAFGNSSIVHHQDTVIVSGMEKLQNVAGYNNTRWTLYRLQHDRWELVNTDPIEHTREPSPLGIFNDGRLFMSANPTLYQLDRNWPLSRPMLLHFNLKNPETKPTAIDPQWEGFQYFNHHSYRTFAVDGQDKSFILFHHNTASQLQWAYYKNNTWLSAGHISWPWGENYEVPQDIRICYPVVQLKNRQVHFLGVSDIVEPNTAWKEYKARVSGNKLDFDFRRLFYTYTTDITKVEFKPWTEIASREKTAGHLSPCDLWIDPLGRVHLLWWEKAMDERLHDVFFPEAKQSIALNYTVLHEGKKIFEKAIVLYDEENPSISLFKGRFQVTPDNRLFVIYYTTEKNLGSNRIMQISSDFDFSPSQKIALKTPLWIFSTASHRNGCEPSLRIDLLGDQNGNTIRYAGIRILYSQ